jgi:hypothetical protein
MGSPERRRARRNNPYFVAGDGVLGRRIQNAVSDTGEDSHRLW